MRKYFFRKSLLLLFVTLLVYSIGGLAVVLPIQTKME